MKSCTYCGRDNEDDAICCVECSTAQFVVATRPSPRASVEFIRLFFKLPAEEQVAVRCAQLLASTVGELVSGLRPDTKWSEIFAWFGPGPADAAVCVLVLRKEFGAFAHETIAASEFMTFRDFVEYVSSHEHNAAQRGGST